MDSGETCGDEFAAREEGGEVSVTDEGLGTRSDAVTVLVDIGEGEDAVGGDGECATHEGQREERQFVLKEEFNRVAGGDNGAETGNGVEEGLLGAKVVDSDDTQVIEVADRSNVGGPGGMSHAPPVLGVGAQDDGELGAERAAHRDA